MTPPPRPTLIAYIDDAGMACERLPAASTAPVHWVLVACAPRMTHRASKWVSHSAREHWRTKWADRLFAQVVPLLQGAGHEVTTILAKGPLPELTRELVRDHGDARVVDARRPRDEPPQWKQIIGFSAAFVLAAD